MRSRYAVTFIAFLLVTALVGPMSSMSGSADDSAKSPETSPPEAHNGKAYYVITGGQDGDQVYRFPVGGGDTVVGAVLQVEGLAAAATKGRVWVARVSGKSLEVDWRAITQEGRSATNYRLEAGDRVFVRCSPRK